MDMPPSFLEGASDDAGHHVGTRLADGLRIGLVNNMPDPALRRTEQQFRSVFAAATGGGAVSFRFATLPSIARTEWGASHISATYDSVEAMLAGGIDALVITGAEPRAAELADEPYWRELTDLLDRIEAARVPTAFCCLAAHAAVLHRDAIRRRRLPEKCFGIFSHDVAAAHEFTHGIDPHHPLPHSRWNEVTEGDLLAAGYLALTRSQVGVGAFARPGGADLFFQGHPEYGGTSLLREYRRDVRRFLFGERDTYPAPPVDGLGPIAAEAFLAFEQRARSDRREALFDAFPGFAMADARAAPWRHAGAQIYRNWLVSAVLAQGGSKVPAPDLALARRQP